MKASLTFHTALLATTLRFATLPLCLCVSIPDILGAGVVGPTITQVIERSQDYALIQNIEVAETPSGVMVSKTNQFTILENSMHYLEDGVWKPSEDLIESFPDGAIARRGPNKAIFNPELNSETVLDVQGSDGKRLDGGIRAIQLVNRKDGRVETVGTIRPSVKGRIIPPDQILWEDAFQGVKADVLIVWRHNLFAQDVVLRERPKVPNGWEPIGRGRRAPRWRQNESRCRLPQ